MAHPEVGVHVVRGFLNSRAVAYLDDAMMAHWRDEQNAHQNRPNLGDLTWRDSVPGLRALHKLLIPQIEKIVDRPLKRHSATFRCYTPGDHLHGHIDADPITVSVSICIHQEYPPGYGGWPLWIVGTGDVHLAPGDMVIMGDQVHGRLPFDAEYGLQVQATLFYQDASAMYDGKGRILIDPRSIQPKLFAKDEVIPR